MSGVSISGYEGGGLGCGGGWGATSRGYTCLYVPLKALFLVFFFCCLRLIYMFIFLVRFGKLSSRLFGNSCSLEVRYVFLV